MKRQPTQPQHRSPKGSGPTAFAEWMLRNVAREIAAGRVRSTVDDEGEAATLH